MARLPIPGQDDGTWGDILNDYLSQSLDGQGRIEPTALTQAGGVTLNGNGQVPVGQLGTGTADTTKYLRGDGSWQVPPGTGGSSTLAGDSDVTIGSPSSNQVLAYNSGTSKWVNHSLAESDITNLTTDLNAKAIDTTVVHLSGTETVTGAKTFNIAPTVPSNSFPESAITSLTSDLDAKVDKSGDVMTGKLTVPSFQVTGGSPATGKVLTSDSSGNALWQPSTPGIVVSLGSVSGTVTCDLSTGVAFLATLTGDTTFQFSNWPSGLVEPEIYTQQDSTGGHAITLSGVTWEPTGSPPTFSTSPNAVNIIPVASFNGGTNVYGITGTQGPTGATGSAGPGICTFSLPGAVSITTGQSRQYFEASYTLVTVRASVGTAPVGSSLTIDVIKNGGSSILSSPLSITTGTNTATTTSFAAPGTLSTSDYLTVNVTAVGSSTAGADLTVTVTVH